MVATGDVGNTWRREPTDGIGIRQVQIAPTEPVP
jgi:hypothetical protein